MVNAVVKWFPFTWHHLPYCLKGGTVQEAIWALPFHLPFLGLTDVNKNIKLINKRMRGDREYKGTLPNKEDIFKRLLRNKVNKENIDRSRTKRKQWGKSHGTHSSKIEIFR